MRKKLPKRLIALQVNGNEYELAVHANRTLLEVLREDLRLTGTKEGCDDGACGTCTVLLDGVPVRSCLCLAVEAQGKAVTTIEGLAAGHQLHPVQQAFVDHGAIQCGYCSPGMILTAKALLDQNPAPTVAEIQRAISGNLCRCTGYNKIVTAIQAAGQAGGGGK
jgi:carbon-monoxide dehydrogenase small subunit